MGHEQGVMRVIEDFKVEAFVKRSLCEERNVRQPLPGDVHWKQLVQYAVSHVVNDFFSMPEQFRTAEAVKRLANKHWTNRLYKFDSADHFLRVKRQTVAHLTRMLLRDKSLTPFMLFESHSTYVNRIDSVISVIFQLMTVSGSGSDRCMTVHKFVVDDSEQVIAAFRHMTVAFCASAFPGLPVRIVIDSVTGGYTFRFEAGELDEERSLDYIRLLQSYMDDSCCCDCVCPNAPKVSPIS